MSEQRPYPPCRMRVPIALLVLLLAACNGEAARPETTSTVAATTTVPAGTTTHAPPPPFEEVVVEVSDDGTHLVDSEGRSLYLFTLDTDRTSSCVGECAEAWPPLLGDPAAGEGVDQQLLGNAERDNGAIQVTYNGNPLYRSRADQRPGDTNGHGFNDVWFLVAPDGTPVD